MARKRETRTESEQQDPGGRDAQENAEALFRVFNAFVPESMRKAMLFGIGSTVLTEQAIRKYLSELRMPSEVIQSVVQHSQQSRNDLIRFVSDEMRNVMRQAEIANELRRFLGSITINISMEIDFNPKYGDESRSVTLDAGLARKPEPEKTATGGKKAAKAKTGSTAKKPAARSTGAKAGTGSGAKSSGAKSSGAKSSGGKTGA
ncbi:MAG: hypothetical protein ACLFOY_03660 [Desulfatibacillaceae bacterium]